MRKRSVCAPWPVGRRLLAVADGGEPLPRRSNAAGRPPLRGERCGSVWAVLCCFAMPWSVAADEARPLTLPFQESFAGRELAPGWTIDASKGNAITVEDGRLKIAARERSYAHIERSLAVDLISAACTLQPSGTGSARSVFLYSPSGHPFPRCEKGTSWSPRRGCCTGLAQGAARRSPSRPIPRLSGPPSPVTARSQPLGPVASVRCAR
jgi:hypothetical protein